ncbi:MULTISPECIES: UvrD-helicase domain-containing protein [unclassified Streptomyces]|uniref:UvrD-helicase domain-containing protein n=1 Tax=unclassified Streptomyces TaxID=2593676 RepID=UPI0006AEEBB5|nr:MULTISPECIES: UvrD-helicase domain-containing protein [unclassified Streptomyces]KOU16085.1 NERD nuclease [Streptomyces sp. WM6349]KOV39645.1 NERD nuclease [Streptomyces sp. H036]
MGAGVSQEARRQERLLREQWEAARQQVRERGGAAGEGERRVLAQLLVLTARGWRLLVGRAGSRDVVLVGPGGVFVVGVGGGDEVRDGAAAGLLAATKVAESAAASLGMSPVAVQPVVVLAGQSLDRGLGRIRVLGEQEVGRVLLAQPRRLRAESVRAIADHLERVLPDREGLALAQGTGPSPHPAPDGLFDPDGLREAALEGARRAPIEQWMTFLHPDQVALVRRNWSGPARISGPAGTGKTVVALHRAAHLARRTTGRILYVTFANNLPRVQSTFLRTMAPSVADRVDFRSLHSWAQEFLQERGVQVRLSGDKAETAFSRAWTHVGRESRLAQIDPGHLYWREEIDYVIKGRGLTRFEEYANVVRRRRRAGLHRTQRQSVWELYEEYEARRHERGVHDFNDVLSMALAEASGEQGPPPYAAVIVDEVQDLTLVGVRLLHALVGDAPNGLLLVGDGQQTVYPGGFRLTDAGIDIRGDRGQVLRTNYRNSKQILDAALAVVADDAFEDIDGERTPGRRDVDLTFHDGNVVRVAAPTADAHDRELVGALRALPAGALADTALLSPSRRALEHYQRLLTRAEIPVCQLEQYDGHPVDAVKLGTYRRAKGLEFKNVLLPRYDDGSTDATADTDTARERAELRRSQLFVAMTRARDLLWLGSVVAGPAAG